MPITKESILLTKKANKKDDSMPICRGRTSKKEDFGKSRKIERNYTCRTKERRSHKTYIWNQGSCSTTTSPWKTVRSTDTSCCQLCVDRKTYKISQRTGLSNNPAPNRSSSPIVTAMVLVAAVGTNGHLKSNSPRPSNPTP